MKDNTKRNVGLVILGSAIAVGGIALYLYNDETARERVQGAINRERAKMYVRNRLNGSDAMVDAVDNLSDAEVNTLVKLAGGASEVKENVSESLDNLVNRAKAASDNVSDRVGDFFN